MQFKIRKVLFVVMTFLIVGCASDYKLGDFSKSYCLSTDIEFRSVIKNKLADLGIEIGVDYCTTRGLIDAMINANDSVSLPVDYGGEHAKGIKPINIAKIQNKNFERMRLISSKHK